MFIILLTVIVLSLLLIHYIFNCNENARLLRKIPGPRFLFIFGHTLEGLVSPVDLFDVFRKWAKEFNGIYTLHAFTINIVNIYNAQDVEIIVSNMKHHEKAYLYEFLKPWLGEGLLLSNGAKWQNRRKVLTPAFYYNILKKYFKAIQENNKELIATLESFDKRAVDIGQVMSDYTLNAICETTMGVKRKNRPISEGLKYKTAIYEVGRLLVYRAMNVLLKSDIIYNFTTMKREQNKHICTVHNFTKNVIEERKQMIENQDVQRKNDFESNKKTKNVCMLDLLISLEKQGLINEDGIQEEVDTFMFEGHDTTAVGLTYCLLMIANEKLVQDKIYAELYDIFGDDERDPTIEDLAAMSYLELCIKESFRLYPPVPFLARKLTEPVTLGNTYQIPSNTYVNVHVFDLHRNEKYYMDPEKFDPDRFLPENSVGRPTYAYIPFSAGPRNCIGQKLAMLEIKSAISSILRNFQIVPVTEPTDVQFTSDIILRSVKPIYVKFITRISN